MHITTWIIILVVLILAIIGLIFYLRFRRKKLYQMFEQVFESSKQAPKQKKHNFILFMFKESIISSKNKNANPQSRINNPKFLELQLIQMGSILKDPSKVTDKNMKRALQMYDAYFQWEKSKFKQ
ncbi:EGFR-like transmembrane domain-containing protein [Aminipila sp.]|uniref:EGFR-like transmembrane domain-containing protein n=1 Tax=Aminipila sp. TaxID=2060095 RepID=UPI00289EB4C2|nr:transmembrane domain-containing protein [Aminipila sp.]